MATKHQRGRVNLLIGIVLVGLGATFLIGQLFNINFWAFLWPFFIIIPGVLFFVGMVVGGESAGPLAIPGSIVTTVGLLLLYQSITNHWESWAYAWALIFPTSVGVGLVINGGWSDIDRLVSTGMKWITTGLVIFLIGGMFFELLLNISNSIVGNVVWPGLLIAAGFYLLMRRGRSSGGGSGGDGGSGRVTERPTPSPDVESAPQRDEPEFEPLNMERGSE